MHALRFESGLFSNPASEPIKLNRVQSLCTCTSFYMYLFMMYVVGSSCYDVCPDKVKAFTSFEQFCRPGISLRLRVIIKSRV